MRSEELWDACVLVAKGVGYQFRLSPEDIEDLVGDTYLKWAESPPEHIAGLYTTARNICIDQKRKACTRERAIQSKRRHRERDAGGVPVTGNLSRLSTGSMFKIDWLVLEEYVGKLAQTDQDIMLLDFVGATDRQGSNLLGITVQAYKSRLRRARQRLRNIIPEDSL